LQTERLEKVIVQKEATNYLSSTANPLRDTTDRHILFTGLVLVKNELHKCKNHWIYNIPQMAKQIGFSSAV
jgi:hypothetical protein